MAIQNKMLDLEEIPDYVNLMVYGKSGVGRHGSPVATIGGLYCT